MRVKRGETEVLARIRFLSLNFKAYMYMKPKSRNMTNNRILLGKIVISFEEDIAFVCQTSSVEEYHSVVVEIHTHFFQRMISYITVLE